MTNSEKWYNTIDWQPKDGQKVDWVSHGGTVVEGGTYNNRLWFLPDGMYVYYVPKSWRHSEKR